jgi:hypothetical protein
MWDAPFVEFCHSMHTSFAGSAAGRSPDKSCTTRAVKKFSKTKLKAEFHTEEAILSLPHGKPVIALEQGCREPK